MSAHGLKVGVRIFADSAKIGYHSIAPHRYKERRYGNYANFLPLIYFRVYFIADIAGFLLWIIEHHVEKFRICRLMDVCC